MVGSIPRSYGSIRLQKMMSARFWKALVYLIVMYIAFSLPYWEFYYLTAVQEKVENRDKFRQLMTTQIFLILPMSLTQIMFSWVVDLWAVESLCASLIINLVICLHYTKHLDYHLIHCTLHGISSGLITPSILKISAKMFQETHLNLVYSVMMFSRSHSQTYLRIIYQKFYLSQESQLGSLLTMVNCVVPIVFIVLLLTNRKPKNYKKCKEIHSSYLYILTLISMCSSFAEHATQWVTVSNIMNISTLSLEYSCFLNGVFAIMGSMLLIIIEHFAEKKLTITNIILSWHIMCYGLKYLQYLLIYDESELLWPFCLLLPSLLFLSPEPFLQGLLPVKAGLSSNEEGMTSGIVVGFANLGKVLSLIVLDVGSTSIIDAMTNISVVLYTLFLCILFKISQPSTSGK